MVPTTVGGIVVLLLLIVPGIWYELLRQRYRPGRTDSAFIEISRILMAGVVISGLTIAILGLVRSLGPRVVADLRALLNTPAYLGDHLVTTGLTLAFFLALSLTMAPIWLHLTATKGLQSGVYAESAWVIAFSRFPAVQAAKAGHGWYVEVEVRLTGDAPPLRGRMAGYSPQLELADRELILGAPLESFDRDGNSWQPVDPKQSLIVIRGSEITQIRTKYRKAAALAPRKDPSRWAATARPLINLMSMMDRPGPVLVLFAAELVALLVAAGVDRAIAG